MLPRLLARLQSLFGNDVLPDPVSQIGVQEDIPVGAQTGIPELLSCALLGAGNVPPANSCMCQCEAVDENEICTDWTVVDESPLEISCE